MTPFFMAWSMFCSIPCPSKKWDQTKTVQMLMSLPFVGLLIGAVWFGIYKACGALHLGLVGSAIVAVLPWLLTGFMHLDGFLDCADAVLSFRDRERRLEILKDSHVGSFAVICMVILGIFTMAAWAQTGYKASGWVLILIPAASRSVVSACVLEYEPLPTSSYAKTIEKKDHKGSILFCIFVGLASCALGLILGKAEGIAVFVSTLCTLLTVLKVRANLGGMSGDISGCAISIGECCAAIALAIVCSLG